MPDDGDDIVRLYETLGDDERYFRFFTMCPADLQARARSITEYNDDQYSLGAFDSGDSGKLLGVAHFIASKDPGYAVPSA